DVETITSLPPICTRDQNIWLARIPIICMDTVEWHLPDRVMRQFRLPQPIPANVVPLESSPEKRSSKWRKFLKEYIRMWDQCLQHIVQLLSEVEPIEDYMQWYWHNTLRYLHAHPEPPVEYMPRGHIERDYLSVSSLYF